MSLGGTWKLLNSDTVLEIDRHASLHDFAGIVLLCLKHRLKETDAIAEFHEVARQLKVMKLIPNDCLVEHIALGCQRNGNAGLIVNYSDAG